MSEIKFYLDENISPRIASTLKMDGIDVVSANDLDALGDTDENHLRRATIMGCVLCTQDRDYLDLHETDKTHAGIAFADKTKANFDVWVKSLIALFESQTAEMMQGKVFSIPEQ